MGFFTKNRFTAKQMKFSRPKDNRAMKEIMGTEGVSEILNKREEQKEFLGAMKKEAGSGGLTERGLKKVLGSLRKGGGKTIDKKETRALAQKLTQGKYIFEPEEKKAVEQTDLSETVERKKSAQIQTKPMVENNRNNMDSHPNFRQPNIRLSSKLASIIHTPDQSEKN